ncbi:MAG: PQQ-binding-like beta-propeller repeat protein, partial [Chthonomonadaceae bacterium]|nr:PQQ-binding-like beta-propeller repeat protein [Chthonomonadaceae bacterium]
SSDAIMGSEPFFSAFPTTGQTLTNGVVSGDGKIAFGKSFTNSSTPPTIYCFDETSGKLIWKVIPYPNVNNEIYVLGINSGLVYAGYYGEQGRGFMAFDVNTGEKKWETPFTFYARTEAVLTFAANGDPIINSAFRLSKLTGAIVYDYHQLSIPMSPVTIGDLSLTIPFNNKPGGVTDVSNLAFSNHSYATSKPFGYSSSVWLNPHRFYVIVDSSPMSITALDLTGQFVSTRWTYTFYSSSFYGAGRSYAFDKQGNLYYAAYDRIVKVDGESGLPVITRIIPGIGNYPALSIDGRGKVTVYHVHTDNYYRVTMLNENLNIMWTINRINNSEQSPVITGSGNIVIPNSLNPTFICFGPNQNYVESLSVPLGRVDRGNIDSLTSVDGNVLSLKIDQSSSVTSARAKLELTGHVTPGTEKVWLELWLSSRNPASRLSIYFRNISTGFYDLLSGYNLTKTLSRFTFSPLLGSNYVDPSSGNIQARIDVMWGKKLDPMNWSVDFDKITLRFLPPD